MSLVMDKNIVPVICDEFKWPATDALPEDMRALPTRNGIPWSHMWRECLSPWRPPVSPQALCTLFLALPSHPYPFLRPARGRMYPAEDACVTKLISFLKLSR